MFFRNLTLFRYDPALDLSDLEAYLAGYPLKPVGSHELASRGFVPPLGNAATALTHSIGQGIWITLGGEDKLLPAAVINDQLHKRVAEAEAKEGRKLGGKARRRLKDDVVAELLPKAFTRPSRINASIDTLHGVVMVDASSRRAAEAVITEMRHARGSFPAVPVNPTSSPRAILTGWLSGDALPTGFELGEECELRDALKDGACWKGSRAELSGDEITKHLEAGKQVTRLALTLDQRVSFVLGEDLVIRKLTFLDSALESLDGQDLDAHAELDARYALMVAELSRVFSALETAFALSPAEA